MSDVLGAGVLLSAAAVALVGLVAYAGAEIRHRQMKRLVQRATERQDAFWVDVNDALRRVSRVEPTHHRHAAAREAE